MNVMSNTVLTLDPAGNHGKEGDGTTGWAIFKDGQLVDFGHKSSSDYATAEEYWDSIISLMILRVNFDLVVCESYKLFGHKAKQQSGSEMGTPQLIGCIRLMLHKARIPLVFQDPKDKVRVTDPILVHMGILEQTEGGRYKALGRQTIIHERDSIRHGVFYHRYGVKK
jgi:hypothetical protein